MLLQCFQISQESTCIGVFFNKLQASRTATLLIKKLQYRILPVKFAKFLRRPCFREHFQWLLLTVSGFQPVTILKKRLRQRCFSVNFTKFLRTSFLLTEPLQMNASGVYLWILRSFSEHFFYRAPLGVFKYFIQEREVAIRRSSFT